MPNIHAWLGDDQDGLRIDPEAIVRRDRVKITIARGSTDLAAQYVRIVPVGNGSAQGETIANNTASQAGVVVIGNADLDIEKGDLFTFRSTRYKVAYVNSSIAGMVQAVADGTQ